MNMFVRGLFVLASVATMASCAPQTYTVTRMEWNPYEARDSKQEKDGIVVELNKPVIPNARLTASIPDQFWVSVQACDAQGRPLVTQQGPVMQTISVAVPGQIWQPMSITNNTDHVLRFNSVAIRLFNPSGEQLEPMTKEDVGARLMVMRPCQSSQQAINRIRTLKIFDRNIEIVPKTTSTFWVPFATPSTEMTGVWKYTIYEVPVQIDQAGRTSRATQFDLRTVGRKFQDTFRKEVGKPPVLVDSVEVR